MSFAFSFLLIFYDLFVPASPIKFDGWPAHLSLLFIPESCPSHLRYRREKYQSLCSGSLRSLLGMDIGSVVIITAFRPQRDRMNFPWETYTQRRHSAPAVLLTSNNLPHTSSGIASPDTAYQLHIGMSPATPSLTSHALATPPRAPHVLTNPAAPLQNPVNPPIVIPLPANPPSTSSSRSTPKLPMELWFMIQRVLQEQVQDHHSLLSLSYACPHIYRNVDPEFVEQILERYPPASSQGHEVFHRRRAEFIRMLQRDENFGKQPPSSDKTRLELVCKDCVKPRPLSLFSVAAPRKLADRQRCLGHEGSMWICPNNVWDYQFVKNLRNRPGDYQPAVSSPFYGPCPCGNHTIWLGKQSLIQERPILRQPVWRQSRNQRITRRYLIEALRRIKVRICPHVSFSDDTVAELFSTDCNLLNHPPWCVTCQRHIRSCTICGTNFRFELQNDGPHEVLVKIVTSRPLPNFFDVTDPSWVNQLALPLEVPSLEREWEMNPVSPALRITHIITREYRQG